MKARRGTYGLALAALAGLGILVAMLSCGGRKAGAPGGAGVQQLMQERGLSEADVTAALKTFTPTGRKEEFLLFASGGHGGNLIVIGVPSMRILKYVAVFTPEPWQGYGFDEETKAVIEAGSPKGHPLTWGDMHHPALSETKAQIACPLTLRGPQGHGEQVEP